jgi:2-oxoglutarate dehydrogenase E1 component
VILSSGKAYFDLLQERMRLQRDDVALLRIEQFYPLDPAKIMETLAEYADGTPVYWYQDEPSNMGAWQFVKINWGDVIETRFKLHRISRAESASPSTGSAKAHALEEQDLLAAAFSTDA